MGQIRGIISALDAEDDQIRGLDAGADDYVSKTASPALLEARIRKALERADRFSKMDAPAAMTKTDADIYRLLESDSGRFFSYREIFSAVCGERNCHLLCAVAKWYNSQVKMLKGV